MPYPIAPPDLKYAVEGGILHGSTYLTESLIPVEYKVVTDLEFRADRRSREVEYWYKVDNQRMKLTHYDTKVGSWR